MLSQCAERYEVSLIAATLRWLAYTERRAVLVLSRDGDGLWARSSESALKTGAFLKTSGLVVPVPQKSVAARPVAIADARLGVELPSGVWFKESCREMSVVSENYDFTISLLQLSGSGDGRFFYERKKMSRKDWIAKFDAYTAYRTPSGARGFATFARWNSKPTIA